MNPRIKNLLEQATTTYLSGLGERSEVDQEKFAELIVQECAAAVLRDSKKFPQADTTWIAAMEESANIVKKHFEPEQ